MSCSSSDMVFVPCIAGCMDLHYHARIRSRLIFRSIFIRDLGTVCPKERMRETRFGRRAPDVGVAFCQRGRFDNGRQFHQSRFLPRYRRRKRNRQIMRVGFPVSLLLLLLVLPSSWLPQPLLSALPVPTLPPPAAPHSVQAVS